MLILSPTRKVAVALLLLDIASVISAFVLVSYLRGFAVGSYEIRLLLIPTAFVVAGLYLIDGYKPRTDMMSLDYTSQHAISLVAAMTAMLLLSFVIVSEDFAFKTSRGVILGSFALLFPLTLGYRRPFYRRFLRRHGRKAIVFIGDIPSCHSFMEECRRNKITHPILFASLAPSSEPAIRLLVDVLDDIEAKTLEVECLVVRESSMEVSSELSQRLVRLHFQGVRTTTLELFHQLYWRKIPLYRINPTWLFQEGFEIAREPAFERVKRLSDIFFSLVGLLVFAPFVAVGALAVWLDGGGPIFFSQIRIGKNRIPFKLYKLRTMRAGSAAGSPYTSKSDARITRVGGFLRATRIDELPQVWNVLKGDMSLIGPRAEWDRLVATYEKEIPSYHFRHLVKPGITGWAQVNYPYGANLEDTLRKLEYDLYYIRHFSFIMDASIILKTIHIMFFGKGR